MEEQLQLMAHVSGWLEGHGLGIQQLTAARVDEYLAYRRACGHVHRRTPRGLAPLLGYLRGLGVASPAARPPAPTASDRLLVGLTWRGPGARSPRGASLSTRKAS